MGHRDEQLVLRAAAHMQAEAASCQPHLLAQTLEALHVLGCSHGGLLQAAEERLAAGLMQVCVGVCGRGGKGAGSCRCA